jgi:hypothetical protein
MIVIPAKAGIQRLCTGLKFLDSRLRGNDSGELCCREVTFLFSKFAGERRRSRSPAVLLWKQLQTGKDSKRQSIKQVSVREHAYKKWRMSHGGEKKFFKDRL